jgi:hypothetical protein
MSDPAHLLVIAATVAILMRFFWRALANIVGVTLLSMMFVGLFTLVAEVRQGLGR